jgi:DNA-binding CsgD family transcriptional regulator
MIRFTEKKLGQVLENAKYYRSGIRSDYDRLSVDLEEVYRAYITEGLMRQFNADLSYETEKHLENTIYSVHKLAFVDAVKWTKRAKRNVQFQNIEDYVEGATNAYEHTNLTLPEGLKYEDVDFTKRDEIDVKLEAVMDILTPTEYKYLDYRLNGQRSISEVATALGLSKENVYDLLDAVKRKCKDLRSGHDAKQWTPYGETDYRNNLELFFLSEWADNEYIGAISTNTFIKDVEDLQES